MNITDGRTQSIWPLKAEMPTCRPLTSNEHADVCVVGAGIAGLTTAYLLIKQGKNVIVISERMPGDGQTGRTSAHLASAIDDRFYELIRGHGEEVARLAYQSHAAAIDQIESIVKEEGIDCDFLRVDGYLFLGPKDEEKTLDIELDAAQLIGFPGVQKLERAPISAFDTGPCLKFPRQGIFHALRYISGLAQAIQRDGGRIFAGQRAIDVQPAKPDESKPASVSFNNGVTVTADAVVVATNTPAPIQTWAGIYTKQIPYRTYMIGARIPRGSVPNALYWDTAEAYHYVRIETLTDEQHDILLVGGEDHKVGQIPDNAAPFLALETWARDRFNMIIDIPYRWSGQVQEPVDGLAYIGKAPVDGARVYIATGDSGMGLTHGTMAGMIITDLVQRRANRFADIYDPARKATSAIGEFIKENLNALSTYKDFLTPGEVPRELDIPKGHGAVVRHGASKVAVYIDENAQAHRCSAVCTHLGCIVKWNHIERTWDCPCHGSRFDPHGQAIMGPATDDLPKYEPG